MAWPHKHQHLYEVSIDQLGLSDKALKVLKIVAITSVGHCINFFIQNLSIYPRAKDEDPKYMDEMRRKAESSDHHIHFSIFMFVEVEQKLKDHGYWSFVEDHLS